MEYPPIKAPPGNSIELSIVGNGKRPMGCGEAITLARNFLWTALFLKETGLMMGTKMKKADGFSLLELLVVLVILALLGSLVVPAIVERMHRSKYEAAGSQLTQLAQAVQLFELDVGRAPEDLTELVRPASNVDYWSGPYVEASLLLDPWGNRYLYHRPGPDNRAFEVISYGRDGAPGGENWAADLSNVKSIDAVLES